MFNPNFEMVGGALPETIPTIYLLIIFSLFTGMAALYLHWEKKKGYVQQESPIRIVSDALEKRIFLNERDKSTLYDPLAPPERRLPEHAYPDAAVKRVINIPTRGYPDTYSQIGVVIRDSTQNVYKLIGRQNYPGSDQWTYYVEGADANTFNIKLPIKVKGDREIMEGDSVIIPGTDTAKGPFIAKIFEYDVPRYIPPPRY
jgi:hypothetical protein